MLSPQLRKKVDTLWTLFWAAGMTNPLVAVEQITYLLFIRQLEGLDREPVPMVGTSAWLKPLCLPYPRPEAGSLPLLPPIA